MGGKRSAGIRSGYHPSQSLTSAHTALEIGYLTTCAGSRCFFHVLCWSYKGRWVALLVVRGEHVAPCCVPLATRRIFPHDWRSRPCFLRIHAFDMTNEISQSSYFLNKTLFNSSFSPMDHGNMRVWWANVSLHPLTAWLVFTLLLPGFLCSQPKAHGIHRG